MVLDQIIFNLLDIFFIFFFNFRWPISREALYVICFMFCSELHFDSIFGTESAELPLKCRFVVPLRLPRGDNMCPGSAHPKPKGRKRCRAPNRCEPSGANITAGEVRGGGAGEGEQEHLDPRMGGHSGEPIHSHSLLTPALSADFECFLHCVRSESIDRALYREKDIGHKKIKKKTKKK